MRKTIEIDLQVPLQASIPGPVDVRGSPFFTQPGNRLSLPVQDRIRILQEVNTQNIENLQDIAPLWAIGPEAEWRGDDAATRKPDFVVYKYESNLAGCMVDEYDLNTFVNRGLFEHTIFECKRRTSNDRLEDTIDQLEEQCMRMENPRECCFAIALKGFRIWFFEYIGDKYVILYPKIKAFARRGFIFLDHTVVMFTGRRLSERLVWMIGMRELFRVTV